MFTELYKRMQKVDLNLLMEEAVRSQEILIIKLNQEQLKDGITSKGTNISPPYASPYYEKKKQKQNSRPPPGVPDLYLKGDFYAGMKMFVEGKRYDIVSMDIKAKYLTRYKDVLDLTKQSKEQVKIPATRKFLKLWINAISP